MILHQCPSCPSRDQYFFPRNKINLEAIFTIENHKLLSTGVSVGLMDPYSVALGYNMKQWSCLARAVGKCWGFFLISLVLLCSCMCMDLFLDAQRRRTCPTHTLCCKYNYTINRKLVEILENMSPQLKLSKEETLEDECGSDRHILKVV